MGKNSPFSTSELCNPLVDTITTLKFEALQAEREYPIGTASIPSGVTTSAAVFHMSTHPLNLELPNLEFRNFRISPI